VVSVNELFVVRLITVDGDEVVDGRRRISSSLSSLETSLSSLKMESLGQSDVNEFKFPQSHLSEASLSSPSIAC
jgi:hypothetical protein